MGKKRKPARVPGTKQVSFAKPKRFTLDPSDPGVQNLVENLPNGLFSIVANDSARYTAFHAATASLIMPYGTRISFHTGCYVVDSCNRAVVNMKEDEDWIMFMGDDHVFPAHMAIKLLALMYHHDLDIIVPTCFKRSFPPKPVLYKHEWDEAAGMDMPFHIDLNEYPQGGLIEVDSAGSAGMIIRKRVIEKMEQPYFRIAEEKWGEDLDFCRRAKELGFRIWADLDMPLGHILNCTIWPGRDENGQFGCEYDFNQQGGFFLALPKEA